MNENISIFDLVTPTPSLSREKNCETCLFCVDNKCVSARDPSNGAFEGVQEESKVSDCNYSPDFKKFEDFSEVVRYIGFKIGVKFRKGELVSNYVDYYQEYVGEKGNIRIEIHKDEYADSELPYIAVDVTEKDVCGGFGAPCDSINETIAYLERKIRLYA